MFSVVSTSLIQIFLFHLENESSIVWNLEADGFEYQLCFSLV